MSSRSELSFTESDRMYTEACKVIVGGTTQAKSPENYIPGSYPTYVARGEGAYLWDVDGNRFIDWILAYGTVGLGYCNPEVDEAAIREIREGFAFPLTRPVQNRLGELLVEVIPCAEVAHLFKSGSDSTTGGRACCAHLDRPRQNRALGLQRMARLGLSSPCGHTELRA